MSRRKWNKELAIHEIKERQRKGLPLNAKAVREDYSSLLAMGSRLFGSWSKALRSAGVDAKDIIKMRTITDKEILDYIRSRNREGLTLYPVYSDRTFRNMVRAAKRHYGSWKNAIAEAGLDPRLADWKLGLKPPIKHWTKAAVLDEIESRVARNLPINQSAVSKDRQMLYLKARELFGSWNEALRQASVDPHSVQKWHKMLGPEILERIRSIYRRKHQLCSLDSSDVPVKRAAIRAFGSWPKAIEKAGLDASVSAWKPGIKHSRWSKPEIVEELKRLNDKKADLAYSKMQRNGYFGFMNAALREFEVKSWNEVLEAAGIDSKLHFRKRSNLYWTKERIKNRILQRVRDGKSLTSRAVRSEDSSLLAAAENGRIYGSWREAVQDAGVDYQSLYDTKLPGYWTEERMFDRIREHYRRGDDISYSNMQRIDRQLVWACENKPKFRSYAKAVNASGLDYNDILKDIKREFRMGQKFEDLVREAYDALGRKMEWKTTIRISNRERLVPDFIDKETGVWIDAKIYANDRHTWETIERYKKNAPAIEIVYLRGHVPRKKKANVTFTNVKTFFRALDKAGRHDLVERLGMLRRNILLEEKKRSGQSSLDSFVH